MLFRSDVDGRRIAHDESAEAAGVSRFIAGNDQIGVAIETTTDRMVDAWIAPIQTVSNSEAGFELVYQGSATVILVPLVLSLGESTSVRMSQHVTVREERFGGAMEANGWPERRPTGSPVEVESGRR